ncbi:hypothetical protein AXF42_Ash020401 [Apostasia shenzhenica]|uniref:Uncharacterized protein n=1 Tax=Apostasia shenzhenica TaxID=1088818 RepID=A0A2I0AA72_9ASPA|nr:hypothetical protein AXF42_Ash020401 [Apostasia shenzhenica]
MFGNEMMDNADTFLTASTDVISSTAQSIPVPDLPISGEHDCEKGFSSGDLVEQSDLMIDSVQKNKAADLTMKGEGATVSHTYLTSESSGICSQISFKADLPNQTVTAAKKMEEKGKARSSQRLGNSWSNKNQKVSNPTMQTSSPNPPPTYQSKPVEQISSSNHVAFSDYGFAACQFPGMSLPPQHIGFKAHPEYSKKPKPAVPQAVIMTPKEKIEKLRRRQQMQAMLAIQKQREQYNHQISGNDCNQNKEDYKQKFLPSDVSSLGEQDQSHIISSSAEGCVEEAIYFQLQDALGKVCELFFFCFYLFWCRNVNFLFLQLDMRVRLNIRDSLYRLARSAMERQSASDRSSTNKSSKEEDDISAGEESNNQDRYE